MPFLCAKFFLRVADLVVRDSTFDYVGGSDATVPSSYADVDAGADADDAGAGDEGRDRANDRVVCFSAFWAWRGD